MWPNHGTLTRMAFLLKAKFLAGLAIMAIKWTNPPRTECQYGEGGVRSGFLHIAVVALAVDNLAKSKANMPVKAN